MSPRYAFTRRPRLLLACLPLCVGMLLSGCKTIEVSESDLLQPDSRIEAVLRDGQKIERHIVQTAQGAIAVTVITRPGNRIGVLYCGGNQHRTRVLGGEIAEAFPGNVDLVLFDYPGYGESDGKPTHESLMESGRAVYDQMLRDNPAYQRRVVYGLSLGGFVATDVAAARHPDRLVLEATAPDAMKWLNSFVPWFAKPFVDVKIEPKLAQYDNLARLHGFPGRMLLLVGTRDSQTKPVLMRRMYEDLRELGVDVAFKRIPGRGHGEALGHDDARQALSEFLTQPDRSAHSP